MIAVSLSTGDTLLVYIRILCIQVALRGHKSAYGRTPLIRAPIGFYAKVRLFKARFEGEAAII